MALQAESTVEETEHAMGALPKSPGALCACYAENRPQ